MKTNPHFAVIFTSKLKSNANPAYEDIAEKMLSLAKSQKGFLGFESVRDSDGVGITTSYWKTEEDIKVWKNHPEHKQAQELGRSLWYESFEVKICKIES